MRYSASEKFEIIELVEQSSLSIPRTLAPIGIPRSTFYDWYSRYQEGGIEALEDGKPRPRRIWNKIPDKIETAIVNLALEEPDLSPRELAVNFTDTKGSFVSEATGGLNWSTQHFILNGKDGVCDESKISSRFQCVGENGVMGSLAAWGVAESDWASVW